VMVGGSPGGEAQLVAVHAAAAIMVEAARVDCGAAAVVGD
jgi:hypothetical protein